MKKMAVTFVLVVGLLAVVGSGGSDDLFDDNKRDVLYKVYGTAESVYILYSGDNSSNEITTGLPWEYGFETEEDALVQLLVFNDGDTGNINLELWVDGKLFKKVPAAGPNTLYTYLTETIE